MILVIGEILYDLFPSYKRIGGAPFNFAFHLKQLGFDVRFVSRVGSDDLGMEILDFITAHGFDPSDLQKDETFPTGRVEVHMAGDGSHSFSIVKHTAYDHIEFDEGLKGLCKSGPTLFYYGTLAQRTPMGHSLVKTVLENLPPPALTFCDINLRPECWTRAVVDQSMTAADILKLSHEELDILVPDKEGALEDRAASLLSPQGPSRIILTRGKKGSLWVSGQGAVHSGPDQNPHLKISDTVGAGDAYAAMAAAAHLSGIEDDRAMAMAHEFAAGICQIKGALPPDRTFYSPFIPKLNHDK